MKEGVSLAVPESRSWAGTHGELLAVETWLRQTGWWRTESPLREADAVNLLPALLRQAEEGRLAARGGRRVRTQQRVGQRTWLRRQVARQHCLRIGWDSRDSTAFLRWVGLRLCWGQQAILDQPATGLVSSHLGRNLHPHSAWFQALRTVCSHLVDLQQVALCGVDTTTDPFLLRAASLFGLPLVRIAPPRESQSVTAWLEQLDELPLAEPDQPVQTVYVSPPISVGDPYAAHHPDTGNRTELASVTSRSPHNGWGRANSASSSGEEARSASGPLRDRLVFAAAARIQVLKLRERGRLAQLVYRRLEDSAWPSHTTQIALAPELSSPSVVEACLSRGAVGWLVLPKSSACLAARTVERVEPGATCVSSRFELARKVDSGLGVPAPMISQPRWKSVSSSAREPPNQVGEPSTIPTLCRDHAYLTHWTRAAPGPWPDQTWQQYYDQLLLDDPAAIRSAFVTLNRIVQQQKLVASDQAIRGGYAVVAFTAVPLAELRTRRQFRAHRGRWDFEPYGLCIERSWLEERGVQAVRYGDPSDWLRLKPNEKPFFQRRHSRSNTAARPIDWSSECEWRHLGDLSLARLDENAAVVFVPTAEEASQLQPLSRWPVWPLPLLIHPYEEPVGFA